MDSGGIALIAVAIITVIGGIYASKNTRKSEDTKSDVQSDANEITEFEANIRAFDLRAKNAEERVGKLEDRLEKLEQKDQQRERQLNRIRLVVQKWFAELSAAWPNDHPMPSLSIEDQELLGITITRK